MTKDAAAKRIFKLRKEIEHHRYLYHVLDRQEISDAALDSLKKELVDLESKYPDLKTKDSPSQRVGGKPLDKFTKVKHSKPVLSLQDVFSIQEVEDWQKRNEKLIGEKIKNYFCELKLDGLTVVLTYEDGVFTKGATRGDGVTGEDVTNNLRTIDSIPLKLDTKKLKKIPPVVEVRGEVVMSKKNFVKLNAKQEKSGGLVYANPRNTAAGTIRQLDPKVASERKLDCFVFELITDLGQATHSQSHQILKDLGFKTSPHDKLVKNITEVEEYLLKWEEKRKTWDYNTDGAVIVVDDIKLEKKLGSIGKAERWMAAYKFPAEQTTTKVKDIVVQVGRTGALTPIAVLEPVVVAGTTVSRATLHNQDEIDRLDVRIGDTVIIQKAGDIIPDILQVLTKLRTGKEKKFKFPNTCPICGSKVTRPVGEVAHYCTNKQCYAREIQNLIHFVSKKALNIEGLGDKIVEQLVRAGLVTTPADFFKLKKEDLEVLERFATKSAENLIESLNNSKEISLAKFIYALGIRHVGEQTAIDLALNFGSLEKISQASVEQLNEVPDIGEVVAESINQWFQDKINQELIADLLKQGLKINNPRVHKKTNIAGKSFVITGTLENSRSYYEDQIRSAGGKVSGSVSAKTDYLLAGDNPGSKYATASKLGVKIITEKEWQKLFD